VAVKSDGSIDFTNFSFATNYLFQDSGISNQSTTGFAPGTRSEYLDEYVVGMDHEFGNSGVIFTARYTDRRIKRIIEDTAPISAECFEAAGAKVGADGLFGAQKLVGCNQNYLIVNPSKALDVFTNAPEIT